MDVKDQVFGMDWSDAEYIGDGVYIREASDSMGIRSVALRTDRNEGRTHHVIVLEDMVFQELMDRGTEMIWPEKT